MIKDESYQEDYYQSNGQAGDRPALLFYERLAKRYFGPGLVMDFGCGAGHLLHRLGRHFHVVGVEASDWARKEAARSTGEKVIASTESLNDGSISGLISIHVVEHIPDEPLAQVLGEWRRLLRPGAYALVVTPDAGGYAARVMGNSWIALADPTHINLKSEKSWSSLFSRHGFRVVKSGADGLWNFPYRYRWLGRYEVLFAGWPTLFQFLLARLVLKPGTGESCIFLLQRAN